MGFVYGIAQPSRTLANYYDLFSKNELFGRLIYFAPSDAHAIPLFIQSKILPVNILYFDAIANLMHDIWKKNSPFAYQSSFH